MSNLNYINYHQIKTNKACFRCKIKACKKRYSVTANSLLKDFPKSEIKDIYEIIKYKLCFHSNKSKTKQYFYNEKNINVIDTLIAKVFLHILETLYYYYNIIYEIEEFGIEGNNDFYSCDESLFTHLK